MPVSVNDYDHDLYVLIAELDLEEGTRFYGIARQVIQYDRPDHEAEARL